MARDHRFSPQLPRQPIDRILGPLERFLHVEAASGLVLLGATLVALLLANSPWSEGFLGIWKTRVGVEIGGFQMLHSLKHWINDGLMVIFFFVIGLEVKRELVAGELRDPRRAALPIAAAGWGIPMATDIAFVVGCLAVLGPRVPPALRIMLLSLAIVDDIGAILVIAVGYTESIDAIALGLAFAGLALVLVLRRVGVRNMAAYALVGLGVWVAFHESGVHATLAGVLLGLMTPAKPHMASGLLADFIARAGDLLSGEGWEARDHRAADVLRLRRAAKEGVSPLEYLETRLHPWVAFVIMPLFALANAGVAFSPDALTSPVALAVAAGLVIGKPVGIVLFSWIAVRLRLASLPATFGWPAIAGGGLLAGIGFTMAIFIAGLALDGGLLDDAKVGILAASAVAMIGGFAVLRAVLPAPPAADESAPAAG